MRPVLTAALLAASALALSGCTGSQTGKAFNVFDSKSQWNTDYSDTYRNNSFWYSGYSDEQIDKIESGKKDGE